MKKEESTIKFKREFVKTDFFKQMSELMDHWWDKDSKWIDNKIEEIRAKRMTKGE